MNAASAFAFLTAAMAFCLANPAQAATLGLPIFTTAPTAIHVTNQFGPDLVPTPSYTLNLHSVIATAQGAPGLIGQEIDLTLFVNGGFDDGTVFSHLAIGGQEILADSDGGPDRIVVSPPETSAFDPVTGLTTFSYTGIFAGFGPRLSLLPEFLLQFAIDMPIPTLNGYRYCTAGEAYCEFSNTPGLTEITGQAVTVQSSFLDYPEGTLSNAVMTFSTVDGRAVAPVPLPAGGALMLGALTGLAMLRKRQRG